MRPSGIVTTLIAENIDEDTMKLTLAYPPDLEDDDLDLDSCTDLESYHLFSKVKSIYHGLMVFYSFPCWACKDQPSRDSFFSLSFSCNF